MSIRYRTPKDLIRTELHNFLRVYGPFYFSRSNLTSETLAYSHTFSTERYESDFAALSMSDVLRVAELYRPLRRTLLHPCEIYRKVRNGMNA